MSWQKDLLPQNALVWLDFRSQFDSNGVRVIKNNGKLATSPSVVICGDGTTANYMPSQLVGRKGVSFDGSDYIKFTLSAPGPDWTAISLSNLNVTPNNWYAFSLFGEPSLVNPFSVSIGMKNSTITSVVQEAVAWGTDGIAPNRNINSWCLTKTGSSLVGYINAVQNSTRTLSGTYCTGSTNVINANLYSTSPVAAISANHYFFALFPKLLTPQQIAMLHDNLMHQFNLP